MTPALRMITPGLLTTIQDLGRPGFQHLGVPVGGALDPVSLRAANTLVGNSPQSGALEALYMGPTFVVEADDVRISLAGNPCPVDLFPDEFSLNGTRIETMRSIRLRRGEVVRIGASVCSAVTYIAVEGGFDVEPVLGSVSTYIRGGFGGWMGRALIAGDRLPLSRNHASDRSECRLVGVDLTPPSRFRVIVGPQDHYFSKQSIAHFFDSEYTIGSGSDRMGMRLDAQKIDHIGDFNIASDGIAPGSIQIPGDGRPIVLLADRQTTGGYPKIATVISADLPALGRMPIGARIAFEPVTIESARAARGALLAEIDQLHEKLVSVNMTDADILSRLFDCNLISGVVNATHATQYASSHV